MPTLLVVAVAGAVGAAVRYQIGVIVGVRSFPWPTLGINLTGCLLLAALLAGPGANRWSPTTTTALAVGLLGAFTTFSTFGYETFTLLRTERLVSAAMYMALSLVGGIAMTAVGYLLGRNL